MSVLPCPSGYTVVTAFRTGDDAAPVQVFARPVLAWHIDLRDLGDVSDGEVRGYPICPNEDGHVEKVDPSKCDAMWLELPSACCVSNYTAQARERLAKRGGLR